MTAEELVGGLRERGYTIRRASGPGWVVIPRLAPDDPICEFLGKLGANFRPFHPEWWTDRSKREYEADISICQVSDEEARLAIWQAAAP